MSAIEFTGEIESAGKAKLAGLETHLRSRIKGQDHVLPRIASVLQRGELGLSKPTRPKGTFLFLGPTGVGKTETALAFTEYLFGSSGLIRFDMSEYQNQESLGLLLGARLGEIGTLGQSLSSVANGTLLFDEIEKAHPRVLDVFLQILDAARVTMASGQILDFQKFYVVFTSNIGALEILHMQHSAQATLERHVLTRAQQAMRPELFARISEKLVFHRLSYDVQVEIAQQMLNREMAFLKERGMEIAVDETVLPYLVQKGFHPKLGARPMRDTIEKLLGDAVTTSLLKQAGHALVLKVDPATGGLIAVI